VLKRELDIIHSRSPLFENKGLKTIKRGSRTYTGKREDLLSKEREEALDTLLNISLEEVIKYVCVVESRNAYFSNQHDTESIVGALVTEL
jgi:hypothetical protein